MAEPSVQMSGMLLASLMFQHVNSDGDSEGLILGQSLVDEQVTISDSQADHIHIQEVYSVQKHVAFHKLNHLYNSIGDVNMEAVKKVLADNKQHAVIGWYRQRRNTDHHVTFRERVVHEKLKASLSNPHVVFVLLTSAAVMSSGSTHKMEYTAFISRGSQLLRVPVVVTNLGLLDQLTYWKVSTPCSAPGYDITMRKHRASFFSSNGLLREVEEMNKMNESLQAELQESCGKVEESERQVETLQAEVSALRRRVEEKRRSNAVKETAVPPEEKNNVLLHEALRKILPCSPLLLLHSQTLTADAVPVPDGCCSSESPAHALGHAPAPKHTNTQAPSRTKPDATNSNQSNCQKRPGRLRKRRNSRT